MILKVQKLESLHIKEKFSCGYDLLDNYLKRQANQDIKRKLSSCTVLVDEQNIVKGYFILSANSIRRQDLPDELIKKLPPSYSDLPVILLGRIAIDKSIQGNGFGEILLFDALKKCLDVSNQLDILAVVVDPIDNKAISFYKSYGFIELPTSDKMFLSMKTIEQL
ncbi:putative GNAT family N-acyltransferase [Arcicella aurantiaca]|uniref:Putative GNAT family N-acyltransferase n=1 Tax=Arcicella aurantiaca TaxID=591202 RepID=A0A316EC49_9BACT|nr:GNAT family N-acetyltransferase [Arcicella aurantiaca]PWK28452.1 putative GNAT family N-acyltransferase [Arcicella aurantiaca]